MAWARAKTAAAVTAAILVATGVGILADVAIHAAPAAGVSDIQGAWEGVVEGPSSGIFGPGKTRLVFKIQRTNGIYSGSIDAIDMALKDVKVSQISYKFPTVRIVVGQSGVPSELKVDREGKTMSGTLGPNLWDAELVLKKTDTPDTVPEPLPESAYAPKRGSDLQGLWTGTVLGLHVNWKIAEFPDGTFRSEVEDRDRGFGPMPVAVDYKQQAIKVTTAFGDQVIFDGNFDGAGVRLAGVWHSGNWRIPVTFTQADPTGSGVKAADKDYSHASDLDLPGHWTGTVDVGGSKLAVGLNIARLADGSYSAALICADFGLVRGAPSSGVRYSAPHVSIRWNSLGAAFDGSVKNGKLTGDMHQGPDSYAMKLERPANE